jgi:hypothetical protein
MSKQNAGYIKGLRALPVQGSGTRIVPHDELVALLADPGMRDAIDTIERVTGSESGVKQVVRRQLRHDITAAQAVAVNKKAIDMSASLSGK